MRAVLALLLSGLLVGASEPCADGDDSGSCAANLGIAEGLPKELPEEPAAGEAPEDEELPATEGMDAGDLSQEDVHEGGDDPSLEEDNAADSKSPDNDDWIKDLYAPDPFTSYDENETDEERQERFEQMGGLVEKYVPPPRSDEYKRRTLRLILQHYAEKVKELEPLTVEETMELIEKEDSTETTEEFFVRLDTNGNGMLEFDEWPLSKPGPFADKSDPAKPFNKADLDQDGKISLAEFPALFEYQLTALTSSPH
mmetsp:Transcript_112840/g.224507  ORF Transcript_112840/g.224507 Transcript_112840/m.224507 type:complete len:255 (-) Transcript_112840:133-897(-)